MTLRWIRPVVDSDCDGDVILGDEMIMQPSGLRVVAEDWSLSLEEDEREEFPSPMLWWAEVV